MPLTHQLSQTVIPTDQNNNEPMALLLDLRTTLTKNDDKWKPFQSMIVLSHTVAEFLYHFKGNQQRNWFILLLITHNYNPLEMNEVLENHLLHAAPIHSIYLLFPDGLKFEDQYRTILRDKFGWCRSYSDKSIYENVRDVGRLTCHERISFYEKQRIQLEYALANNDPNIARSQLRLAMRQKSDHARLLAHYLQALANEVDEDC